MNFLVNSKVKTQAAPSRGIKMNAEMAITGQKRTGCSQLSQSKMHCTNNSLQALRVTPELVSLVCLFLAQGTFSSQHSSILYHLLGVGESQGVTVTHWLDWLQSWVRKSSHQTVDTMSHSVSRLNLVTTWWDCAGGLTSSNSFPGRGSSPSPSAASPGQGPPFFSFYLCRSCSNCQSLSAPCPYPCAGPKTASVGI